jgi:NAD(P)H-hydrate epimerase
MALPDWLDPLYTSEEMRAVDKWAIEEQGVPSLDLMERAGLGLARVTAEVAADGPVRVVIGKGNNGGDGLVAARLLREDGRDVRVLLTADPGDLRGDAAANLERLPGAPQPYSADGLDGAACIVDALLGTGFQGEPRGVVGAAIDAINDLGAIVVAADVPSGVDASTGEVSGAAVRAAATATFHAAKPGLWIAPGKTHAGEVVVIDIGIPDGAPVAPAEVGLIAPAVLDAIPPRESGATKFTEGCVIVVGGSAGLTGAPRLAATAAARAGAGYVIAAVSEPVATAIQGALLEVMTRALPAAGGGLGPESVAPAMELIAQRADAVVLGPGLGGASDTVVAARALARDANVPLVIDADGLNAHAGDITTFATREAATVLSPHAGELGRLLGVRSKAIDAQRLSSVRAAAVASHAIVVLKGDDTLVAGPDGTVAVSRGGCPALATAGTGDVLAGVLGALLAKRMEPFTAACAAVELHATAGRLAAIPYGPHAVIASDVIAALPAARGLEAFGRAPHAGRAPATARISPTRSPDAPAGSRPPIGCGRSWPPSETSWKWTPSRSRRRTAWRRSSASCARTSCPACPWSTTGAAASASSPRPTSS